MSPSCGSGVSSRASKRVTASAASTMRGLVRRWPSVFCCGVSPRSGGVCTSGKQRLRHVVKLVPGSGVNHRNTVHGTLVRPCELPEWNGCSRIARAQFPGIVPSGLGGVQANLLAGRDAHQQCAVEQVRRHRMVAILRRAARRCQWIFAVCQSCTGRALQERDCAAFLHPEPHNACDHRKHQKRQEANGQPPYGGRLPTHPDERIPHALEPPQEPGKQRFAYTACVVTTANDGGECVPYDRCRRSEEHTSENGA